jgi:hypothetical protein
MGLLLWLDTPDEELDKRAKASGSSDANELRAGIYSEHNECV